MRRSSNRVRRTVNCLRAMLIVLLPHLSNAKQVQEEYRSPGTVVVEIHRGDAGILKLTRPSKKQANVRYFGGQASGCAPIADAFAEGADVVRPVERPDTVVRSLSIGSPASSTPRRS